MKKFIIKRLLLAIMILFFVSFIIYALMRCLPTSFVEALANKKAQAGGSKTFAEWMAQLNAVYGLDKGLFDGYGSWISKAITGDFGESWKFTIPVTQKFADVIWYSFVLNVICFILEMGISIPLGILAARKQYSRTDYTITTIALMGISLPSFFFATVLKLIFCVKLGWFDLFGVVGKYHEQLNTPLEKILDMGWHYILPVVTLTIVSIGALMRYTRTNMLEVLNSDYIRTARAKGLSEKVVINKHAFRNTLIPIVTIVGGMLPGLFSGAMITETLFGIPGIGYTSYQAMVEGDIPFTMFYMLFLAILTLLGTLLSDILYAVVDPRVRVN
ncbi:MAG: ABC transporter permease [Clostridiales bacterium]|nr:ABC transporter permease [Clostridiales bacterium]